MDLLIVVAFLGLLEIHRSFVRKRSSTKQERLLAKSTTMRTP